MTAEPHRVTALESRRAGILRATCRPSSPALASGGPPFPRNTLRPQHSKGGGTASVIETAPSAVNCKTEYPRGSMARLAHPAFAAQASVRPDFPKSPPMASDSEASPFARAVLITLAALALYVLSFGPVSRVYTPEGAPLWVLHAYLPLLSIADRCAPVEAGLKWYTDLWGADSEAPSNASLSSFDNLSTFFGPLCRSYPSR